MIEPTETESKETLDQFCDAMIQIAREAESNPAHAPRRAGDDAGAPARPDARRAPARLRWTPRNDGMSAEFRLLVTEPLDGAANMALDEALLLGRVSRASAAHAPLLRLGSPPPSRSATASLSTARIDLRRRGAPGHRARAAAHRRQRHPA